MGTLRPRLAMTLLLLAGTVVLGGVAALSGLWLLVAVAVAVAVAQALVAIRLRDRLDDEGP